MAKEGIPLTGHIVNDVAGGEYPTARHWVDIDETVMEEFRSLIGAS